MRKGSAVNWVIQLRRKVHELGNFAEGDTQSDRTAFAAHHTSTLPPDLPYPFAPPS